MFPKKLILLTVVFTLALLGGGVYLVSKSGPPELTASVQAQAETLETTYDWGEIGINNGHALKSFIIKNTGTDTLTLANVTTSCACTTAQISLAKGKSPFFGMHSKSGWVGEVFPGESAELLVDYDPAFHGPSGVGDITRQITVDTNDSNNPTLTFNLTARVIK